MKNQLSKVLLLASSAVPVAAATRTRGGTTIPVVRIAATTIGIGLALLLTSQSRIQQTSAMTTIATSSTCSKPITAATTSMTSSATFLSNYVTNNLQNTPLKLITVSKKVEQATTEKDKTTSSTSKNDKKDDSITVVEAETITTFDDALILQSSLAVANDNTAAAAATDVITIVFIIRRPGCILCREHAQQLNTFINDYNSVHASTTKTKLTMIGIIKEINIDNYGLYEFISQYYTSQYPIYLDTNLQFYNAFGNRSILKLTTWNPITIYKGYQQLSNRLSSKSSTLSGNYKGEGLIQGGFLIINNSNNNNNNKVECAFEEQVGTEINLIDLQNSIDHIVQVSTTTSTTDSATGSTTATIIEDVADEL